MHAVALLQRVRDSEQWTVRSVQRITLTRSSLSTASRPLNYASPLRTQSDRPSARRQRAHGAVQLAAGARGGRHVHPAHRGHRRRAIDARVRGGDPRGPALARASTGTRGRTSAARTVRTGSPSGCTCTASYAERAARERARRTTASARAEQLEAERQAALAAGQPAEVPGHVPRDLRRPRRAPAIDAARAGRSSASACRRTARSSFAGPRCAATVAFHTERHRRSGPRALRRHARLQLRRRGRRCADGGDARDSRRGSHLEHAAADAALRGARVHAAGVRAPGARDGAGSHAAVEAARRDVGRRVPRRRATCPRRW